MARYKFIDTSPRFLAVNLKKQLLPRSLPVSRLRAWAHLVQLDLQRI